MRRSVIIFFGVFVLLIIGILIINKTPEKLIVTTFNVYGEKMLNKKVVFLNTVTIKAPADDFVENIEKTKGDYVEPGSVLLRMENKEEAYQLAKSKNEFAISLLNSGKAIQEEKRQAVELAENKLENTLIRSPIEGFIVNAPVNENLFVSKGTVLFELLPIDSSAYFQISSEEEVLLRNAELVEIHLKPTNLKWLLDEIQILEQNNNRYTLLSKDINEIDQQLLNSLYCEIIITYIESKASWIPAEFVYDEAVFLVGERKKEISILEQKNDLILVQGLNDEDILIKKR